MKKIKLILLLISILFSFNLHARKIVVSTAATLQTAFNGGQNGDTIILKPGTYNVGTAMRIPATGAIVLKSANKDSMAIIQMDMQTAVNVADSVYPKKPSVIFEYLHLQGRYGNIETASAYIINLNSKYFSMDTLAFRHCEISKVSRCVFRSGAPSGFASSGQMEWFEMTNCIVHEMNSRGNNWPVIYSAHIPSYVIFRNNTFYDMPRVKSIYQFKLAATSGRNAEIYFENNTLAVTYFNNDGIISTANYLGEETKFQINNNMFITPNWADYYNLSTDTVGYTIPPIIKCTGGIITATNNLVDSCKNWKAGQTLDIDGNGGFLVIDTANTYRMRNLNFSLSDFANPQGNDFSFLSTKLPATAGTTGGPIGDPRWVKTLANPRTLNVSANIAAAVVTPTKGVYEDGASVKLTASVVDGYTFKGWKKVSDGSLQSTANPYTFNITSDMDITADYLALPVRNVAITLSGSNTATYTITPQKAIYYEGDVITLTLNTHYINNFLGWSDGNTNLTRTLTLSSDLALTANFSEYNYVVAWDFHQLTANNKTFKNLAANHASNALNPGVMNFVSPMDTITMIATRNNKFTATGKEVAYCVLRKTLIANFSNPNYVYISFSTKGLDNSKDLIVKSAMAADNSIFKVQKMQYSLDGVVYTDFATDTITAADTLVGGLKEKWMNFEGTLPEAAKNQDLVNVRWIADTNSERLFASSALALTSDGEYAYISKIVVLNDFSSTTKDLPTKKLNKIYSVADKLFVNADAKGTAEVFTIMGQKIKKVALNAGVNEITGLKSGIYMVRIGSDVQKVLIK